MMNLKTHTVYPEIQVDADSFEWVARLYTREGDVADMATGPGESYDGAKAAAVAWVDEVSDAYLREA